MEAKSEGGGGKEGVVSNVYKKKRKMGGGNVWFEINKEKYYCIERRKNSGFGGRVDKLFRECLEWV